ncbi:MAG: hypothetical protein HYS25_14075 [Ignavibacteriales bacterium]|nr:hypothetical protein [Ignavibacteriales bacterium]
MEKIKVTGKNKKNLVKNILLRERAIIINSMKATEEVLRNYETKNGMKSSKFYKKYLNGEMGDAEDFMLWAAQIQSLERLKSDINDLDGVKVVD